eukprot:Skav204638  [mRNA]  locus=scaffold1712:400341:403869:- [translate_table: standard]
MCPQRSGFDYSKWDRLEISDDEAWDTFHPNLDKGLNIRVNRITRDRKEDEINEAPRPKMALYGQAKYTMFKEENQGHCEAAGMGMAWPEPQAEPQALLREYGQILMEEYVKHFEKNLMQRAVDKKKEEEAGETS